jgi:hypothetical protein
LPEQAIPARNIRQETITLEKRAANIFVGCFSLALHTGPAKCNRASGN